MKALRKLRAFFIFLNRQPFRSTRYSKSKEKAFTSCLPRASFGRSAKLAFTPFSLPLAIRSARAEDQASISDMSLIFMIKLRYT